MRPADGSAAVAAAASVFIRVLAVSGIDTAADDENFDPADLTLTVTVRDGGDNVVESYTRDLSHRADGVLRIVRLDGADAGGKVYHFWAVYDRSLEYGAIDVVSGDFPFDHTVTVGLFLTDSRSQLTAASATFRVETRAEHDQAAAEAAGLDVEALPAGDPEVVAPYEWGSKIVSGSLAGAMILWDENEPVAPRFGAVSGVPALPTAVGSGVGVPLNLQPPTVFSTPVAIFIPLPNGTDPSGLNVYLYDGAAWVLACTADGTVAEGGQGWMVPGSRVDHADTSPPTIEMRVYHFSGVQAGTAFSPPNPDEGDDGGGDGVAVVVVSAGGGCFIATAAVKRVPRMVLLMRDPGDAAVRCVDEAGG